MTEILKNTLLDRVNETERRYRSLNVDIDSSDYKKFIPYAKALGIGRTVNTAFAKLIGKPLGKWPTRLITGDIFVLPPGDGDATQFFLLGSFEPTEIPLLKFLISELKEGDIFYDIGSNYGFYSTVASLCVGSTGQVHSFEASPQTFYFFKKNNSDKKNIHFNNKAVSDVSGTLTFYDKRGVGHSGGSTIEGKIAETMGKYNFSSYSIPSITLDKYILTNKIPSIIKIDVEGAEIRVLKGMEVLLKDVRPLICMEFWGGDKESHSIKASQYLIDKQYKLYSIDNNGKLELSSIDELSSRNQLLNIVFKPV